MVSSNYFCLVQVLGNIRVCNYFCLVQVLGNIRVCNYFCLVQVLGNIGYAIISVWYKFLEISGMQLFLFGTSSWKYWVCNYFCLVQVLGNIGYAVISVLKGTLMLIVKKMQNIQIFQ